MDCVLVHYGKQTISWSVFVSSNSHQQSFCDKTPLQTDKSLHTSQGQESHGCKARPWPRVDMLVKGGQPLQRRWIHEHVRWMQLMSIITIISVNVNVDFNSHQQVKVSFTINSRDRMKGCQFSNNKIVTISTLNRRRWPLSQRLTWSSINTKLLSGTNPGIYLIITTMVKKSSAACSSNPNGKSNSCGMCCESCRFGIIKFGIQSGMNSTMHDPDCNPPGFNMLRTQGSIRKIVQPHDRTHLAHNC